MARVSLHPLRLGAIALAAGLLQAQVPHVDEEEQALSAIQQLIRAKVTTASRVEESGLRAPAKVLVVSAEQIRRRGYRSLLDLIEDLPDFKVERNVHEHFYTNFSVRGVPGPDKFLVLQDGIRITGPTNEPVPIFENYPVHHLRKVEVVYGPTSALYGADAVSAVVNLITRERSFELEGTVQGGQSGLGFANIYTAHQFENKVKFRFAGQAFQEDQPPMDRYYPDYRNFEAQRTGLFEVFGGGLQRPTLPFDSQPSQRLSASALYFGLDKGPFRLTYSRNQSKFPASNKNTPDHAIYSKDVFIGQSLQVASLAYSKGMEAISLNSSLSFAHLDLNPNSNYRDIFGYYDRAYKFARSSSLRGEVQVNWTPSPTFNGSAGLTVESFKAIPWSADLTAPVDPHGQIQGQLLGSPGIAADFVHLNYENLGSFLQARVELAPRWNLTLGLRFDRNSRYGSSLNPRAGLVYELGPDTTLKASYGSAFLAPSPYEAYLHYGAFNSTDGGATYTSGFWRLPNPDLKPIRSNTIELSAQHVFQRRVTLEGSLYRTVLTNLFQVVSDAEVTHLYDGQYKGWPVDYIAVQTNLGRQETTGGNLHARGVWNTASGHQWEAYAAYSYVDGKVDRFGTGERVEIERVAPHTGKAGLEWSALGWSLSSRLTWIGTQRVVEMDPSTGRRHRLPGYRLINVNLGKEWQTSFGLTGLRFSITNALDARYRNINYEAKPGAAIAFFGVPQEPRRISLGLSFRR